MATQALWHLLTETAWEELDYLMVDMPPGTGDIQLSLSQKVPVAGSLVVTTPQDVAPLCSMRVRAWRCSARSASRYWASSRI
jgi:ATP-binding protein involved in chromosome partitioning